MRRGEAAARRKGRKLQGKRPLRVRAARRGEDDEEGGPVGLHWYVIGLSILVVAGLSVVNVLTLPDKPGGAPHQPMLRASEPTAAALPLALRRDAADTAVGSAGAPPAEGAAEPEGEPAWREPQPPPPKQPPPKVEPPPPQRTRPPSPQAQEWQKLAQRARDAAGGLQPGKALDDAAGVGTAAAKGGVASFEGDSWMSLLTGADADEIMFSAWIFLPKVDVGSFPVSSGSMKTIASTKISGCEVQSGVSDGWSLWVHEWGTTNQQLRLSWTAEGKACNELFSRTVLVPYDKWTLVGFTLSREQNCARLFLGNNLVADTRKGIGEAVSAGSPMPLDQVDITSRAVRAAGQKAALYLGAHQPQPKDSTSVQSHVFIGFIGDLRLVHVAGGETSEALQLMRLPSSVLLASGLVPASAVALDVQFQVGAEPENLVDSMAISARRSDNAAEDKDAVSLVPFAEQPRAPILADTGVVAGTPGPTLEPAALRATWPAEWTSAWSEEQLLQSQREADPWANEVRDAMRHSWAGYRQKAWGYDEVKPVTGGHKDWCRLAITMLDSLSTLWIMELRDEFDDAEAWLRQNTLPSAKRGHGLNSLFEITIRAVGGLLSAHSLSGRPVFLETAQRLVDKMLPAFDTEHGMPHSSVDVGTGEAGKHTWQKAKEANTVLAEPTTIQVEFRYLSHVTGDPTYQRVADRAENAVLAAAGSRGIVPLYLNNKVAKPTFVGNKISMGAMGDSYYEYLLKQWVQTGRKEDRFKDAWKLSVKEMVSKLVIKTRGGLTFITDMESGKPKFKMDHLACFVAGMLMLGARTLPKEEVNPYWEELAAELARTCYEMYKRSPTGLSPEYVTFKVEKGNGEDMVFAADAPHNLLRPEAIEALYYMHYYTGDPKYRRWAHEMFSAFLKHSRARFGFSAVVDVRKGSPSKRDSQESFWLAETLKYFYLIFSPRSTLNLEEFVLNTEAHPLRIWTTDLQ